MTTAFQSWMVKRAVDAHVATVLMTHMFVCNCCLGVAAPPRCVSVNELDTR